MRRDWFIVILSVVAASLALWGCDAIKDEVEDSVDKDFEEDSTFGLEITVTEESDDPEPAGMECGLTTVNEQLAMHDIDTGDVDIDDIELNLISAQYRAQWDPPGGTVTNCGVGVWSGGYTGAIFEHDPNGDWVWTEVDIAGDLGQAVEALNYALDHRDADLYYCAWCNDDGVDTYTVEYEVDIEVTVTGEISG